MAKGKHAQNKGQIRQEKVLHPTSRKVLKIARKATHRSNVDAKGKVGMQRLSALAEKFAWLRDNLPGVLDDEGQISKESMLELVGGLMSRFDEELEQINIKKSIGGKHRKNQHNSREDAINHTMQLEKSDFEGCGMELPDLFDPANLEYFTAWNGEVRFVQNIKLRRMRRAELEDTDEMETAG
eukprot:GFUD01012728.1.p1 GENE.GFUD01012728.1~~GFUD01012728.1.p1  ORF type:complete len:183 (-),score=80.77 GFUD01012728.1:61-609(-)